MVKMIHGITIQEYQSVHYWIKKNYGKASKCENPSCTEKSKVYQWALKKGKRYEYIRDNFFMLCRSCHSKYDLTEDGRERLRIANSGFKKFRHSPVNCEICQNKIEKSYTYQKYCDKCRKTANHKIQKDRHRRQRQKRKDKICKYCQWNLATTEDRFCREEHRKKYHERHPRSYKKYLKDNSLLQLLEEKMK